jgi:hypothetical protein
MRGVGGIPPQPGTMMDFFVDPTYSTVFLPQQSS